MFLDRDFLYIHFIDVMSNKNDMKYLNIPPYTFGWYYHQPTIYNHLQ